MCADEVFKFIMFSMITTVKLQLMWHFDCVIEANKRVNIFDSINRSCFKVISPTILIFVLGVVKHLYFFRRIYF